MELQLTDLVFHYKREILVCSLVLARIAPLILFAPALAARQLPPRLRIALVLCLTLLLAPVHLNGPGATAGRPQDFVPSLLSEALIGASIALALSCVATGLHMAGQLASSMSGMSLAQTADGSNQASAPLIGRVIELVALSGFFVGGGHRMVLDALLDTFRWAPLGHMPIQGDLIRATLGFVAHAFDVAVRVAAPMAVALLVAVIVVGLLSRAVPQLNTLSVGLGLNAAVLLAILSLGVGSAIWIFHNEAEVALATVRAAMGGGEW